MWSSPAAAALYSLAPDIKACTAGALSVPQKRRVLETMNAIRALQGLAPVTYDESAGAGVMQIAPMIAANRQVSHAPSALWNCYTPAGHQAAQSRNFGGGASLYLSFVDTHELCHGLAARRAQRAVRRHRSLALAAGPVPEENRLWPRRRDSGWRIRRWRRDSHQ
jgi:hypothetical protein